MTINLTKYDKSVIIEEFSEFLKNKEEGIPVSVFTKELSPFESIVHYMVYDKKYGFSECGKILNKDRQVIWATFKRAKKKIKKTLIQNNSNYLIPFSALFSEKNSVAETVVSYLINVHSLKISEVAKLLKKSQKTVWTLNNRALKKGGKNE